MDLTDRKKRILRAVIESYIQNAEPVGSKAVAEWARLNVSSATIRNEMADLENLGYLEQPHTSAGRVPSPKGYRLYVNELMDDYKLSIQETQRINQALHIRMKALDRVIDEAGRVVAKLTQYPAFALASGPEKMTIRRFDLLLVDQSAFIAVVMTDSNVVRNKLFRLSGDLSESQLQMLGTLLNTGFTGLTLAQLTPELARVSRHATREAYELIELVVNFGAEVLDDLEKRQVHTAGIANLLEHPEYQSLEKAQPLMSFLSDEEFKPLPSDCDRATDILIGPENVAEALKDSSVVMATYDLGDGMRGLVGVVGPTRMDYAKISARLSYFAKGLTWLIGQGGLPPGDKDQ
ncbi:MAG: heat-inducible transcriptional repressor HrcA [Pseudoflavonifractor sp.]|nr:heat-inducible transcriptional repressor HrcA [Pseudoflavonifractor sp.]MDY3018420.1 heat-inducible transcriptional repressor HrcA [Oscillospiraceae bacterium]